MTHKRTVAAAAGLAAFLGASAVLATPAQAQGGNDTVRAGGTCGTAVWKLKAKPDNGAIEIEFELDTNRVGQTWHVRITDNTHLVTSRDKTTLAPSGSFTVHARTNNRAGVDVIRAIATRGDRHCGGALRY